MWIHNWLMNSLVQWNIPGTKFFLGGFEIGQGIDDVLVVAKVWHGVNGVGVFLVLEVPDAVLLFSIGKVFL